MKGDTLLIHVTAGTNLGKGARPNRLHTAQFHPCTSVMYVWSHPTHVHTIESQSCTYHTIPVTRALEKAMQRDDRRSVGGRPEGAALQRAHVAGL